jgi:hypothetical protein
MGAAMLARPEPEQPAAAPAIDNSAVELIQGMLMAQSQSIAKFEKKMDDRTSNLESMAMQAAMNGAKQTSQTGASQQCSVPGPLRHPLTCAPRGLRRAPLSPLNATLATVSRVGFALGGHGDGQCNQCCKV